MLKLTKLAMATACAALTLPAHADTLSLTPGAGAETLNLGLNQGVAATLTWDNGQTQAVTFDGAMQELPVKGNSVTVTTSNPITTVICVGSHLTALDLSGIAALKELNAQDNLLTSLKFGAADSLAVVNVAQNTSLTSLGLPASCPSLSTLICASTAVEAIPAASAVPALTILWCQNTPITELRISSYKKLRELYAFNTSLSTFTAGAALREVFIDNNRSLSEVTFYNYSQINTLSLSNCALTRVNISKNANGKLKHVYLNGNNLTFSAFPSMLDTDGSTLYDNYVFSPQNAINIATAFGIGGEVDFSSQIAKNYWGVTLTPTVTWYAEDGSTLTAGSDFESSTPGQYKWLKAVGEVYAEITAAEYPGVKLTTNKTTVYESIAGIEETAAAAEGLTIAAEGNRLTVTASAPAQLTVVSTDGVTVISREIPAGVFSQTLPAGIYVVNNQKIVIGR